MQHTRMSPTQPRQRLLASLCMLALSSCSQSPAGSTSGAVHTDAANQPSWFSTTQAAETLRWPAGKQAMSMPASKVVAFANHLSHPRWLYSLPNGDILVAESKPQPANAGFSLKQWMHQKRLHGADDQTTSHYQITLLRDNNDDGVADERHVFIQETALPVGVALVGDTLYMANSDTLLQFAYHAGQTHVTPVAVTQTQVTPIAVTQTRATPVAVTETQLTPMAETAESDPANQTMSPLPDNRAKTPLDLLTETLQQEGLVPQRPANVLHDKRGYLLVADDVGNVIWHVKGNRKVAQQ